MANATAITTPSAATRPNVRVADILRSRPAKVPAATPTSQPSTPKNPLDERSMRARPPTATRSATTQSAIIVGRTQRGGEEAPVKRAFDKGRAGLHIPRYADPKSTAPTNMEGSSTESPTAANWGMGSVTPTPTGTRPLTRNETSRYTPPVTGSTTASVAKSLAASSRIDTARATGSSAFSGKAVGLLSLRGRGERLRPASEDPGVVARGVLELIPRWMSGSAVTVRS